MTWRGVGPSGYIGTFNSGGGTGSFDYEPPRGDVSGVIDNLIVIQLQGRPVSPLAPISGYVYSWNGNSWVPTQVDTLSSGVGPHELLSLTHPDTFPASPITGDIITASGVPVRWGRFPIGLQGQKLRVSPSGGLVWSYDALSIITTGATVNLTPSSHRIVVNKTIGSNTTVNLPTSPFIGQEVMVKDGKGDANMNPITVQASGSMIDAFTAVLMRQKFQALTFMWNGTIWNII
jgi:hypothetical protein